MPEYFYCAREPVNSFTHFIGAAASLLGTVLLILKATLISDFSAVGLVSAAVFGLSLFLMYSASYIYHYASMPPSVLLTLRKIDHSMIYVLIAGTYTPVLLCAFPYPESVVLTAVIWSIAGVGILMKAVKFAVPRWLYTLLYILMGWFIVVDIPALMAMPRGASALLLAGGISYTIGALIYALRYPKSKSRAGLGFHEIFHLFVMLGSLLHFLCVFLFIV